MGFSGQVYGFDFHVAVIHMNIKINGIDIYTNNGRITYNFDSQITYIYGNIGVGKSTLLSLLVYCLGGNLVETPAIKDQLASVGLRIELAKRSYTFRREYRSAHVFIDCGGGVVKRIHKREVSDFIYRTLGIAPIYYEQKGNGTPNQLTLRNYLWYSYLKQSDIDSNFFYLNSGANEFYQTASMNALASLFGEGNFIDAEQRTMISALKKRIAKYENGIGAINYVIDHDFIQYLSQNLKQIEGLGRGDAEWGALFQHCLSMYTRYVKFVQGYKFLKTQALDFQGKTVEYDKKLNDNLTDLGDIFKQCLLSVGFPGILKSDKVVFDAQQLRPAIVNEYTGIEYNFDSLGSGGKKTLFKICFLFSVHIKNHFLHPQDSPLLSLIIIDTPTKNISEREDKELFNHLYTYMLEVFRSTLSDTQVIIVDKERNDILASSGVAILPFSKESPLFPEFVDIYGERK